MPTFTSCRSATPDKQHDQIIFDLVAHDGKQYPFAMTSGCLAAVIATGINAAVELGPAPIDGQSVAFKCEVGIAIVDLEVGLLLQSGPLTVTQSLSEADALALIDGLQQAVATLRQDRGQKH